MEALFCCITFEVTHSTSEQSDTGALTRPPVLKRARSRLETEVKQKKNKNKNKKINHTSHHEVFNLPVKQKCA